MKDLTNKQVRFVEEYLIDLNATQAAIRAGYSENSAKEIGCENLAKPKIKPYIEKALKERSDALKENGTITIDPRVIERAAEILGSTKEAVDIARNGAYRALIDAGLPKEYSHLGKRTRSIDSDSRYTVLFRANFRCQACGAKPSNDNDVTLHIDHITPFSWGGSNDPSNLQVLCSDCNISKSNFYNIDHNED